MPILQGASGVTISGNSRLNDVAGDMIINDSSSHTTNHDSHNTTNERYNNTNNDYSRNDFRTHTTRNDHRGTVNNFGNAKNVNTGTNYGTISQDDNRDETPPWIRDGYAQRGYYPQGYRPSYPHSHSAPPAGPYWQEEAQYYGHPPYQPQSAYPPRAYPAGSPPYQDRGYYGPPPQGSQGYPPGMGEPPVGDGYYGNPYEREEFNPHGPVPLSARGLTPASHPQARPDMTASAPPSVASSSNASAHGATPPSRKSNNPFGEFLSKDGS